MGARLASPPGINFDDRYSNSPVSELFDKELFGHSRWSDFDIKLLSQCLEYCGVLTIQNDLDRR